MKQVPTLLYIDNFFTHLDIFESSLRTDYKYYDIEQHIKLGYTRAEAKQTWPGYRTNHLDNENPIFFALIIAEMEAKFPWLFSDFNITEIPSFLHQRLDGDDKEDFIHIDTTLYTLLVYLSDTNLESGTKFYDEQDNCIATINFVKNRAVLFEGGIRHKGFGHHGTDLSNGRLTLNCFIN